jgi:hypothetical protein
MSLMLTPLLRKTYGFDYDARSYETCLFGASVRWRKWDFVFDLTLSPRFCGLIMVRGDSQRDCGRVVSREWDPKSTLSVLSSAAVEQGPNAKTRFLNLLPTSSPQHVCNSSLKTLSQDNFPWKRNGAARMGSPDLTIQ